MTDPVVAAAHVTKRYGATTALDDVTVTFQGGAIHAVVGANGAGKTTLFHLLVGLMPPDGGRVVMPPRAATAFMADASSGLPGEATVAACVRFFSVLGGKRRRDAVRDARAALVEVGLDGLAHRKVRALSAGQRRRAAVACALVRDAAVFVLDEPTRDIDVPTRLRIWDALRARAAAGATVIVASHDPIEVLDVSDHITLLRHGRVADPADLLGLRDEARGQRLSELKRLAGAL